MPRPDCYSRVLHKLAKDIELILLPGAPPSGTFGTQDLGDEPHRIDPVLCEAILNVRIGS